MAHLTIVAHIYAKPERADFVLSELKKVVPATRLEDGCVQYDLHRDRENPVHFMFYENWESRELWQAHMKSSHLAAYKEATAEAVERTEIYEMSRTD